MAYCAGDLREHMDVLAKTDSADGRGFPVQAWTVAHASVACSVSDVSGRDFYAAYAAGAQNTVTFVCRYIAGVNTANRVRYQGGDYEILQVNHLQEKRDFMQLKCVKSKPVTLATPAAQPETPATEPETGDGGETPQEGQTAS